MKNIFLYLDKKGAEWVVVAFLSQDERMMGVCERNENPHVITASHMFGVAPDVILQERKLLEGVSGMLAIRNARAGMRDLLAGATFIPAALPMYDCGKRSNHGLNYQEGYRGFALINAMMEAEAKRIVEGYTNKREVWVGGKKRTEYGGVYPGIARWHDDTAARVKRDKFLLNCWGRKIPFMGVLDGNMFRKAFSAVPQSTVVDLVNRAMVNAHRTRTPEFRLARLMQQTHDSLTYQFPLTALPAMATFVSELAFLPRYLNPPLAYHEREFRIGTDMKIGFSLGSKGVHPMLECPLSPDPATQLASLERVIDDARSRSPYFAASAGGTALGATA